MLTELCELSGPFTHVLTRIRDELALSVYSDYYAAEDGTLSYEQTPYFAVVGRLEREKERMLREQEEFRMEMLARAEDITTIEERMRALEGAVRHERQRNADLASELDNTTDALEKTRAEAKQTRDELKRLRKEFLDTQEDNAQLQKGKAGAELEEYNQMKTMNKEYEVEMAHLMTEIEELKRENMAMIDIEAHEALQEELDKIKKQSEVMKEMLGDQAAAMAGNDGESVVLTPRPDWRALRMNDVDISTTSTRELTVHVKERLARYEFWKKDEHPPTISYKEAVYLLPPEPDAAHIVDLQKLYDVVDGLPREEGADADAEQDRGDVKCLALGTDPSVPRYLRYDMGVPVCIMSKEQTINFCRQLMKAKEQHEKQFQRKRMLYEFLYYYLQAAHPSHPALAKFAYNLVMSLRRFSYHPEVKLCLRVLSGSLPEEAYHDRVKMEKGLLVMFRACDAQRNGGSGWDQTTTGLVSMDDAVKVLNRYFPEKPDHAQVAVHQALHSSVDGEEQIPYMDLFSDDPQFGQLLLQLRKQHLAEILDYGDSLESYLVAVPDMEAKLRNLNANLLAANMPLLSLRNALSQYDEDKPPAEIDLFLKRGAGLAELSDVPVAMQRNVTVDLKNFTLRLKGELVKRSMNYDETAVMNYKLKDGGRIAGGGSSPDYPPMA